MTNQPRGGARVPPLPSSDQKHLVLPQALETRGSTPPPLPISSPERRGLMYFPPFFVWQGDGGLSGS